MQLRRMFAMALALAGCSPSLDWRETRFEDGRVTALFPCKPERRARSVTVASVQTRMEMLSCTAGGATFALSSLDIIDPAKVTPAMVELRQLMSANIDGRQTAFQAVRVAGMTPNAEAVKVSLSGRLPDGAPVQAQTAFFARGARVYQASVLAVTVSPDAADTFFSALKLTA